VAALGCCVARPLCRILQYKASGCCREHSLADALETSYNVLRVEYLRIVSQTFTNAATWQDAEAAMFAIR